MRFSRPVRSSKQCLPSPNGLLIATLFHSVVNIRDVRTLDVVKIISLPSDLSGPVYSFQWSPSSRLVLVAVGEQIVVLSATPDGNFQATIGNAVPPGAKPVAIGFGPVDTEIWVFSSLGLKLTLFDLQTSRGVEINNPKFSTPASACNGLSFRSGSNHLAIMTRAAGRDVISIHDPVSNSVLRSWQPDTIDAQGLAWSPDGKWLVVWESDSQGHKVVFYTPDGNLFRAWTGPTSPPPGCRHYQLGAGVRLVQFSGDARQLAIGDSSRGVYIIDMTSIKESMLLTHPHTIAPQETVQVWQEQVNTLEAAPAVHTFIKADQALLPPSRSPTDNSDTCDGTKSISYDCSSTLVATILNDSPGTLWIWDTHASELRAVLLFHADIRTVSWHPSCRETLMIRCDGELYSNIVFVWDPLSEGPRTLDFTPRLPQQKTSGITQAHWLHMKDTEHPSLFFSDGHNYVLAVIAETGQEFQYWEDAWDSEKRQREESPLELVPGDNTIDRPFSEDEDGHASELEDTFIHKH